MSESVIFKPLYGVLDEKPMCYLLTIGEVNILLDCGWNDSFDVKLLEPLRAIADQISLVLITFADLQHMGALPYIYKEFNITAPIYSTVPTHILGGLFLYDTYMSKHKDENFDLFNLEDIDFVIQKKFRKTLQYMQPLVIHENGVASGLSVTPMNAGHMLGGAMWRIKKHTNDIIYAVDINHAREKHLNGCHLSGIERPTVLITDAYSTLKQDAPKNAINLIIQKAVESVRRGKSVLIPVDSAGRMFELLLSFDSHWQENRALHAYPLILLHQLVDSVLNNARGYLEWISDRVSGRFEKDRFNPLEFMNIDTQCKSIRTLNRIHPSNKAKIVFVPSDSLATGMARQLVIDWGKDQSKVLILTDEGPVGSFARDLWDAFHNDKSKVTWDLVHHKRVLLEGLELEEYMKTDERKALDEDNMEVEGDDDSEDDEGYSGKQGIGRYSEPRYLMFGYSDVLVGKIDAYGEYLKEGEITAPEFHNLNQNNNNNNTGMIVKDTATEENIIEEEDIMKLPSKVITQNITLVLVCERFFIKLGGRSDKKSIRNIVESVDPTRLVLVHATKEATEEMKRFILEKDILQEQFIFTPNAGESIDVGSNMPMYHAKLRNFGVSTIGSNFPRSIGNYNIAYCDVKVENENMIVVSNEENDNSMTSTDLIQDHTSNTTTENNTMANRESSDEGFDGRNIVWLSQTSDHVEPRDAILLGLERLKFVDIQRQLNKVGIESAFIEQVLVCDDDVIVKREIASGEIFVEGPISDTYFKVQDIVLNQFVII